MDPRPSNSSDSSESETNSSDDNQESDGNLVIVFKILDVMDRIFGPLDQSGSENEEEEGREEEEKEEEEREQEEEEEEEEESSAIMTGIWQILWQYQVSIIGINLNPEKDN